MNVIKMNSKFKKRILNGEKTQTIRLGERPFKLGDHVLEFEDGERIWVDVNSVKIKALGTISQHEIEKDGFKKWYELYVELLNIYGEGKVDNRSLVTLVEWRGFNERSEEVRTLQ